MLLPTKFDGVQFMKTYVMQKSAEISALIVQHKLTTHTSRVTGRATSVPLVFDPDFPHEARLTVTVSSARPLIWLPL